MAYRLPSHLHRSRHGVLYFRIAIPADLRDHFVLSEVYRSLHTARVAIAGPMAQSLALAYKSHFRQLRENFMCAKQRRQNTVAVVEWITEIKMDELRRPTSVVFTSQPDDPPGAMESAMLATLKAMAPANEIVIDQDATTATPLSNMSDLVAPYLAFVLKTNNPNQKTLESYRVAIALFIEIVGDKPLSALSIADQNIFEDTITRVPANRAKIASARGLTLEESLTLAAPKLSLQTAKNHAQRTNNFLAWACRRVDRRPPFTLMDNVRVTARSKDGERRAFNDAELKILFEPVGYTAGRKRTPYMFWVPLIALHSGMRINEIAQLEVRDIVTRDGVTCFDVNDLPDSDELASSSAKKVKTAAGRRIVPVHDALISLGLLDFVNEQRRHGRTRVFPDLVGGRDGPGQAASKFFGRLCDRLGLVDSGLVFHSFRHGAIGRMRGARVAKEISKVLVGHSHAEDVHDNYGDIQNDFSVADRKLAIEALRFTEILDYQGLKARRPTSTDIRNGIPASSVNNPATGL